MLNTGRYNLGTAIDATMRTTLDAAGCPAITYSALWHALVDAATVEPTVGLNAGGIREVARAMRAHEDTYIDGGILG